MDSTSLTTESVQSVAETPHSGVATGFLSSWFPDSFCFSAVSDLAQAKTPHSGVATGFLLVI